MVPGIRDNSTLEAKLYSLFRDKSYTIGPKASEISKEYDIDLFIETHYHVIRERLHENTEGMNGEYNNVNPTEIVIAAISTEIGDDEDKLHELQRILIERGLARSLGSEFPQLFYGCRNEKDKQRRLLRTTLAYMAHAFIEYYLKKENPFTWTSREEPLRT